MAGEKAMHEDRWKCTACGAVQDNWQTPCRACGPEKFRADVVRDLESMNDDAFRRLTGRAPTDAERERFRLEIERMAHFLAPGRGS